MSAAATISFAEIAELTRGRIGRHDTACPICGPSRQSPVNRRRRVLRIWHDEPGFASFHCARCGHSGWARENGSRTIEPARLRQLRAQAAARDAHHAKRRRQAAQALWRMSVPAPGSPVEAYLAARGIRIRAPATTRFLPPRRPEYHPAMIAAFGMAEEPEPGLLAIRDEAVQAAHLTLLRPDGSSKAGTDRDKFAVGPASGWPIVLAPPNDLLALGMCEGIEDGLSLHEAAGYGVWAAGGASHLPALADKVPQYLDCVTAVADPDPDGRRHARRLVEELRSRGFHTEAFTIDADHAGAAA